MATPKEVYAVIGYYRCPSMQHRGTSSHMAFLTAKEARDYCLFHSNEHMQFVWNKLTIGKFNVRVVKNIDRRRKRGT